MPETTITGTSLGVLKTGTSLGVTRAACSADESQPARRAFTKLALAHLI